MIANQEIFCCPSTQTGTCSDASRASSSGTFVKGRKQERCEETLGRVLGQNYYNPNVAFERPCWLQRSPFPAGMALSSFIRPCRASNGFLYGIVKPYTALHSPV